MKDLSRFIEMDVYPDQFTIWTVLGRIFDGLGFRYYWATEGLREEDIDYDPGHGARTVYQTLNHIYNMVDFIGCTVEDKTSSFPEVDHGYDFPELRRKTLDRIEAIKLLCLGKKDTPLENYKIKIDYAGTPMEYSLWHLFNGPILDTYFHLGQIVSYRRILDNPMDAHVQPFLGKRVHPEEA